MTPAARPALSVVLVAYGSRDDLARCLPTLCLEGEKLEVIVVDNGPDDGAAAWLGAAYPEVRVLKSPVNGGYAGGNNLGVRAARGEYVLVLNPDTEAHLGALGALLEAARRHPDALITAKLVQPDGTLNACGLQLHPAGIATCRGLGERADAYAGLHPVPLVSGAAFVASKGLFEQLGGFCESYFMYLEDAELSLRARLLGHPVLCAGDARITHHYALKMSPTKFYYLERNRLLTLLRLYEGRTLRRLAPALLSTELLTWGYALLKGPRYLAARGRGYGWLWRHRRRWRAERRALQRGRVVADEGVLAGAAGGLPFRQLLGSAPLARGLERLTQRLFGRSSPALRRPG